jgi:hypothetical protein
MNMKSDRLMVTQIVANIDCETFHFGRCGWPTNWSDEHAFLCRVLIICFVCRTKSVGPMPPQDLCCRTCNFPIYQIWFDPKEDTRTNAQTHTTIRQTSINKPDWDLLCAHVVKYISFNCCCIVCGIVFVLLRPLLLALRSLNAFLPFCVLGLVVCFGLLFLIILFVLYCLNSHLLWSYIVFRYLLWSSFKTVTWWVMFSHQQFWFHLLGFQSGAVPCPLHVTK